MKAIHTIYRDDIRRVKQLAAKGIHVGASHRHGPANPGREKILSTTELGYLHCGPAGAGHFVKMVHNGIEYGLMAAYAEGLNILQQANIGKRDHTADAETSPLHDPEAY